MKNSFIRALIGAFAAGTVLLSLSAASWSMGHGGMGHDPARMVAHIADRLDLTSEQKTQVEALMASATEQSATDRARLRQLREEMHAQRDNFNAGQAQKIADEIGEITARMVYAAANTHAGIYQLLDEEQKAEMDSMLEQRDERRAKWRKEGRKSRE